MVDSFTNMTPIYAQTLAGDPPIYAKPLEIDHVPRRPSYTGEPPEARRALLNMRGNYGRFVLNLGLFMHDRSLFGVCSVKNGGFAKKYPGFAKKYPGFAKENRGLTNANPAFECRIKPSI